MLAYLTVSAHAVSAVLLVEKNRLQLPVYYVIHILAGVKQRYLLIEKFVYALLIANKKLCLYFESHNIVVLSNQPLRSTLKKYESSGRMLKWAIELAPYVINYKPRRAINGQALADFIAKYPVLNEIKVEDNKS